MIALLLWGCASEADTFASPQSRFRVRLQELQRRTFSLDEQLQSLENHDHVVYRLCFLRNPPASGAAGEECLATASYTDVYGFDDPPVPTPIERIFTWLLWSPQEDFVVLPAEGWATAPGPVEQTVVNLRPERGWRTGVLFMGDLVWADTLVVYGNSLADCDYAVRRFDGATGAESPFRAGVSPDGFMITASTDSTIVLTTLLDNCASTELRESFRPRCSELHLRTLAETPVPCPPTGG
jgi:hypothetical protein